MSLSSVAQLMGLVQPEPVKAMIYCLDDPLWSVFLQYNPESIRLTRDPSWQSAGDLVRLNPNDEQDLGHQRTSRSSFNFLPLMQEPDQGPAGRAWKGLHFRGGSNDRLSFSTLFDQTEHRGTVGDMLPLELGFEDKLFGQTNSSNVLEDVAKLYRLTLPIKVAPLIGSADDVEPRPPACAFFWGNFQFMGVIDNLDVEFQVFDTLGQPVRARVSLTLTGAAMSTITATASEDRLELPYTAPEKKVLWDMYSIFADFRYNLLDNL